MEGTRVSLICLLAVTAGIAAVSGNVVMKQGCQQGPEFWCQDMSSAILCGAVDHCKQTMWNDDLDIQCMQCKQMVTLLIAMVKSSSLKSSVKKLMHKTCNLVPFTSKRKNCIDLMDQYLDVVIGVLGDKITPNSVCVKLKQCSKDQSDDWTPDLLSDPVLLENIMSIVLANVQTVHETVTQNMKEDLPIPKPMCYLCKSFISKFEKAVPKELIAKSASGLCLTLPTKIAGVCQCLVEKYTIILVDTLLGKLGPKLVCGLLLMCASDENCEADLEYDVACETCLAVTYLVKPTTSDNATAEQISTALSRVCTDLLDWKECHTFLEGHQKELSQLLLKPWDYEKTCQVVGACPAMSKPITEASGCAAGPSYWCQSLDKAKECNAIGHCLANVWH
ncbi:pulmonary surfactant-associated protein B [Hyperolius riggenbachi]|uniref:pulmonary surfactant-associated protein B n=1 Tax=Hyperolius riggenbachi TaxID=752182 RepID=UPI0035A28CD1